MKDKEIAFLEEYKTLCLKHGFEVAGFDNGAFISVLNDEQKKISKIYLEKDVLGGHIGFADEYQLKQNNEFLI